MKKQLIAVVLAVCTLCAALNPLAAARSSTDSPNSEPLSVRQVRNALPPRAANCSWLPDSRPPPSFAAAVISLLTLVNIAPLLASSAPFLCLIFAHFE